MEVGAHCERSKGKKKETYKPTVKQKREQGLEERKEINLCGKIAVVTSEKHNTLQKAEPVSKFNNSTITYATPLIKFSGRVNGKEGEILLDSGSSSNFVSISFVRRHRLLTEKLPQEQLVQLADGTEHKVRRGIINAAVRWDGWNGTVTLLMLPLQQYDMILGMTWLKEYNPRIDWKTGSCIATHKPTFIKPADQNKQVEQQESTKDQNQIKGVMHRLSALAMNKTKQDENGLEYLTCSPVTSGPRRLGKYIVKKGELMVS